MNRSRARELIDAWVEATSDHPTAGLPADWPLAVWQVLVDDYPDYRYWAAHQVHCPEAIVRRLATDRQWRVRSRVAQKRNLPGDLFAVLAADPNEAVRCKIACNQKTPLALVETLTQDPAESVAGVAAYNLRARMQAQQRRAVSREQTLAAGRQPGPATMAPRLAVLLAREAPVAVILRRGPSKQTLLVRWNLEDDTFEAGQWIKGRVHESRCDLSPDGELLIAAVAGHRGEPSAWTAISRPPYFSALALWPLDTSASGGGVFAGATHLILAHPPDGAELAPGYRLPRGFRVEAPLVDDTARSAFGQVFGRTMRRGGWRCQQVGYARGNDSFEPAEVWWKRSPARPVELELTVRGYGAAPEPRTYALLGERGARVDLGAADWADWCPSGDLLLARRGTLYRVAGRPMDPGAQAAPSGGSLAVALIDLAPLTFSEQVAPARARRWSGPAPSGTPLPSARRPADDVLGLPALRDFLVG